MDKPTLDKFRYLVNKKKNLVEICALLGKEVYEIHAMIAFLQEMGEEYEITESKVIKIPKNDDSHIHSFPFWDKTKLCFVADPHYGSKYDRPDIMKQIYFECHKREISTIICAGDFTNGYYPRRKNYLFSSKVYDFDEMVDYVANTHPYSKYINFYTIGGNHDATYDITTGKQIIPEISKVRKDIIYLGQDLADITVGSLSLRVFHGYGKKTKTLEERVRRCYNKMNFEFAPDVMVLGHIHHSLYMPIEGTHIFQTAALVDEEYSTLDHSHLIERSCWFVNFEYDDEGALTKVMPEYMSFGPKRIRRR